MGCGEEECLFVKLFVWEKHKERSRERLLDKGETWGEGRGWLIVALGELGLFPVRRPGFLGGNIGWISPRRLCCWDVCQVFPVPCRIWHQTQKPVGEVVYTETLKSAHKTKVGFNLWETGQPGKQNMDKTQDSCESSSFDYYISKYRSIKWTDVRWRIVDVDVQHVCVKEREKTRSQSDEGSYFQVYTDIAPPCGYISI